MSRVISASHRSNPEARHTRDLRALCAAHPAWLSGAALGLLLASVGCQPAADPAPDYTEPFGVPNPSGNPNDPNNVGNPNNPIGGGGEGVTPVSTDTGLTPPGTPLADCATPGPQALRRLTGPQLQNTLAKLFGRDDFPKQQVLADPANLGFKVDADALVVSNLDSELIMNYAEQLAEWARGQNVFSSFANNCNNAADANCRRTFIENFGRQAYREPLTEQQITAYDALFTEFAAGDFNAGAEVVVTAMLQSPNALYRRELGSPSGAGQMNLTAYEVASQLSYLLTDNPPDAELFAAAQNGSLLDRTVLDAHAERLMNTPAGQETLKHFLDGWIETEKLRDKAKDNNVVNMTQELRDAMAGETHALFVNTFQQGLGLEELFLADYTFVNQELAQFYGIGGISGPQFQQVPLPPDRAPGILGHASYLTSHAQPENSSPVQRAFIVRERLLCQDLPPVPGDLDTSLDEPNPNGTNRERYTAHSSNEICYSCHRRMDPIGFAFENYDGFGRFRTEEAGKPVDATGELSDVPGGPIPLDGVDNLAAYLATSELAQSCLVRYWTYYAYGRDTWEQKQCNHDAIRREASADNFSLRSVMMGIIHAQHFSTRVAGQ